MATYEIYVVTTCRPDKGKLSEIKQKLCAEFGGLTIIKNCSGLWVNNKGTIESDKVEIWRIVTDKIVLPRTILDIGEKLKVICGQKSQLVTTNGFPYYI